MIGQTVGNYQVTGELGRGGMGVVYAAEHPLIGQRVALKVLLPEYSRNGEVVQRFFNEARAMSAINHPGIVRAHDFGYLPNGSAYIVMEHLEGETLTVRLERDGRLAPRTATALVRQIAAAVGEAHGRQIVHRDLKPDNVFLTRSPDAPEGVQVKVLDFGIAKLLAEGLRSSVKTRLGAVMGTPPYMSPEQCEGKTDVDARSDIYSLGCILHQVLCGHPPFPDEDLHQVMAHHRYSAPPPLRSIDPSVPPALEGLVLQMLAKRAQDRPRDMAEVIQRLDLAMQRQPSNPPPLPPRASPRDPTIAAPSGPSPSAGSLAPGGTAPGHAPLEAGDQTVPQPQFDDLAIGPDPGGRPQVVVSVPDYRPARGPWMTLLQDRRRLWIALGALAAVAILVIVIVAAATGSSSNAASVGDQRGVFTVRSSSGTGTGFLVEHGGELYGVTAFHVVPSDDRVLLEREAGKENARYTIPLYADVAYAAPKSDLAILRFDRGVPRAFPFLGRPLKLATTDELKRAEGKVQVWGSSEDAARPGVMTTLHDEDRTLRSRVTKVSPVDVFTGKAVTEASPDGFTITPQIHPGFSGGPVLASIDGNEVVIGVAITLARQEATGDSASAIVAASEVTKVLEAAAATPRPNEISDPNATSGFNLRGACEETLNEVVRAARSAPPSQNEFLTALLANRSFGGARYNVYDRLAPESRRPFFNREQLTQQIVYPLIVLLLQEEQETLKALQTWFHKLDEPPYCRTSLGAGGASCMNCSFERLCTGTVLLREALPVVQALVQLGVGLADKLSTRGNEIVPLTYDFKLHEKWQPKESSPTAPVTLTNGRTVAVTRAGKQVITFRYDVKGAGFPADKTADFEYAQGRCGLALDEESKP